MAIYKIASLLFLVIFGFSGFALVVSQEEPETNGEKTSETKPHKLGPNHKIFIHIRKLWLAGDFKKLQNFLDDRVRFNLGKYQGKYPQEQAVGILKSYFSEIKTTKLEYTPEKMSISLGVAVYEYQIVNTGLDKKQTLYFYLVQKKTKEDKPVWLITSINEI